MYTHLHRLEKIRHIPVSHSSALPPAAGSQHKRNCCHAEHHHGNLRIVSITTACDAWMGAQNLGRHKTFISSWRFVASKSRCLHNLGHLMMLL